MPALQPVVEVHALGVGENLNAPCAGPGMKRQTAAGRLTVRAHASVARRGPHGVAQLVGGILIVHGEVGPCGHGRRTGRLNLRLLVGRNGRRCNLRGGCGRGFRRRRRHALHRLQRLLVHHDRLLRNGLDHHLGLKLPQRVGRHIQIGQILALLNRVDRIDHPRHLENVLGNPGKSREQRQMEENGDPDALAQPRPAPLVFELADHLQQFVGVVVHPARTAKAGRHRTGRHRTVRGQLPAGGWICLCVACSRDAGLGWLVGLVGFVYIGWCFVSGHAVRRSYTGHTRGPHLLFVSFRSILSFRPNPCRSPRLVQ